MSERSQDFWKQRNPFIFVWTLYDSPSDYPDQAVIRRNYVDGDGAVRHSMRRVYESVAQARADVPKHCICLGREPEDDPCIVESYV